MRSRTLWPFLAIEPRVAGFNIAFKLKEGATMDDAHTLARQMRSMIVSISLTVSGEPLCRTSWKGRQLSSDLQHKPGGKWLNHIE